VVAVATLFAAQLDAPALVSVVRMSGWARSMRWGDTGLAWVPPSPNLPTLASNDAYVASVFLEATTASEGRGTTLPFTLVGAPWLNATALSSILNDAACSTDDMRGELAAPSQPCTAAVRAAWFTPTWFKHNGTVCEGVQWVRVAHPAFPTFADGMRILTAVRDLAPPGALRYDGSWFGHPGADLLDWYAGTPRVRELLQAGAAWQAIVTTFEPDAAAFRTTRAPFLLYSESDSRRDGHSGGHSTGCWEKRAVEERQEAAVAKAAAARERGDAARAQSAASAGAWADVQRVLEDGVAAHAFPGAVALVGGREGTLFASAVGAHTYEAHATRMAVESSLFDVASLTKVTATTTAAMLLYQWGELDLGTRLVEWFGAAFAHADARKARMSVLHLLTHTAGWPPDPTPVSYCAPSFRCPQTDKPPQRRKLSFACRPRIVQQLYTQTLAAEPGAAYVYSDLSMITLMWAVGRLARRHVSPSELSPSCAALSTARPPAAPAAGQREAAARVGSGITAIEGVDQCYYEAFVRRYVLSRLAPSGGGTALPPFVGFRPAAAYWPLAAPTWNDTSESFPGECVSPFRERLLQGEVSDGNAYAMGGIAGHAGLFATAPALLALLRAVAFAPAQPSPSSLGVNATTAATFTTVHNASVSSRALGWDTNAPGSYLGCGNWSAATFTHTGYTGTMLCADAAGGLLAVLLTNRVYPRADARSATAIHRVRQRFSDAVLRAAQSIHRPPSTI
jgi:CubicO group peptidase (beta-lactamase class C family)